ncbi:MAG: DNA polymerase IV, partial [Chitinivibrionales bacterium]|nr:DNA polymerase IV [Chitinivibrionales bacterium]
MPPRVVLHLDMDAFFTSVEQRDNPLYKGKPVVVGARPGHRGVVAAASYEARKFGVHSALPISQAFARCPQAVFLPPRMEVYSRESDRVMAIAASFTPCVEQVSVDEAFLDITGTQKLFGDAHEVAAKISRRIREELHLTASIGIAPNKFLAKVASDMHKPDGITAVPFDAGEIIAWLAPHPVGKIWGVGKKTEAALKRFCLNTIGDLQRLDREFLVQRFGAGGASLYELCRGIDDRPVENRSERLSISREHTFERDTADRDLLKKILLTLAQDVARRARKSGMQGKTIVLIYRGSDFTKHTRRATRADATALANDIYAAALKLLEALSEKMKIRLIGVGLSSFSAECGQLDLFTNEKTHVS